MNVTKYTLTQYQTSHSQQSTCTHPQHPPDPSLKRNQPHMSSSLSWTHIFFRLRHPKHEILGDQRQLQCACVRNLLFLSLLVVATPCEITAAVHFLRAAMSAMSRAHVLLLLLLLRHTTAVAGLCLRGGGKPRPGSIAVAGRELLLFLNASCVLHCRCLYIVQGYLIANVLTVEYIIFLWVFFFLFACTLVLFIIIYFIERYEGF